jgi:filamentous hemagglutinin family protein
MLNAISKKSEFGRKVGGLSLAIALSTGLVVGVDRAWAQVTSQVISDETLGTNVIPGQTIRGLPSDLIDGGSRPIDQSSGKEGANLFHSFKYFDVGTKRGVYFRNPAGVENIFSRVTGGNLSNIDGKIGVWNADMEMLGSANLFLLNPNGIVFGPNASLDVAGSFLASTASSLLFDENGVYHANPNDSSLLSVKVPSGVQFGRSQSGVIANEGNLTTGGKLELIGSTVLSTGELNAPGGNLGVITVATGARVVINPIGLLATVLPTDVPTSMTTAVPAILVELAQNGRSGLRLNESGQVVLTRSSLPVVTGDVAVRQVNAQTAILEANHNLTLVESQLQTSGGLSLRALDTVRIQDRSVVPTETSSRNIYITAQQGSVLISNARLNITPPMSDGTGNIEIYASKDVRIENGSSLEGKGILGYIFIGDKDRPAVTPASVTIDKSSLIATNDLSGPSGWIRVAALERITINNANLRTTSSGDAKAGRINLSVNPGGIISLNEGSRIDSSITGTGITGGGVPDPGITLQASGGKVTIDKNSLITTATDSARDQVGSPITITAREIYLANNSSIDATTTGVAQGGKISFNDAASVEISGSSLVNTAVQEGATGKGGDISISTDTFKLNTGGRVQSSTRGGGDAGTVQLNFTDTATIAGFDEKSLLYSGILTDTKLNGKGGNIKINTPNKLVGNLTLSGGAFLSAQTDGSKSGGNIDLNVNKLDILNGSQVLTSSTGTGRAGDIAVQALGGVTISGQLSPLPNIVSFLDNKSTNLIFLNPSNSLKTPNPEVEQSGPSVPYTTVQRSSGNESLVADYYSFVITKDGSQGVFDVDNSSILANSIDTQLFLYDRKTGQLLATNDDSYPADAGSVNSLDSLLKYNFNAGEYVLAVSKYRTEASNNAPVSIVPNSPGGLNNTSAYRLQASLQNQGTSSGLTSDRNPKRALNSDFKPELISSGLFAQNSAEGAAGDIRIVTPVLTVENLSATKSSLNAEVSVSSTQGSAGNLYVFSNRIFLNHGTLSATTGQTQKESGANIFLFGEAAFDPNNPLATQGILKTGLATLIENPDSIIPPNVANLPALEFVLMRNGSQIKVNAKNQAQGGNILGSTQLLLPMLR